jgi:hypothetical protein
MVAGVVVLAAVGIALWLLLGDSGDTNTAADSSTTAGTSSAEESGSSSSRPSSSSGSSAPTGGGAIPPPTLEPEGLGDDPLMDQYAQSCYDGDMAACDTLFKDSELGSDYEAYGDTCAGRQPLSTDVFCTRAFPTD